MSACDVRPDGEGGWWVEVDGVSQTESSLGELGVALEMAVRLCADLRIDGADVHDRDGRLHSRLPVRHAAG